MSESRANLHSSLAHALSRPPSGQGQRFREGTKEGNVDRDKMLDVTLQQIEKQFGKGAVMKLGEHPMGALREPCINSSGSGFSRCVVA